MTATVELITGVTGSGKTSYAVSRMLERLEAGQRIATNIALTPWILARFASQLEQVPHPFADRWVVEGVAFDHEVEGAEFVPGVLGDFARIARLDCIIIDEIGRYAPERADNEALRKVLQQHRHLGLDLVFLLPSAGRATKLIRDAVKQHYHIQDSSQASGLIRFLPLPPLRMVQRRDGVHSGPADEILPFRLHPDTYRAYDTQGGVYGDPPPVKQTERESDIASSARRRLLHWVRALGGAACIAIVFKACQAPDTPSKEVLVVTPRTSSAAAASGGSPVLVSGEEIRLPSAWESSGKVVRGEIVIDAAGKVHHVALHP